MAVATNADLKVFHPEFFKVMFLEVRPPQRLYRSLFRAPLEMGLYSFSMGSFDDPFAILPPVDDLEDAKSMFAEQGVESYELQDYRGFVDISNKIINQFTRANNMSGLITMLRERYAMLLREGFENTMEYTCFHAMDSKASALSGASDWTSSSVTADDIIEDLQKSKQAVSDSQRVVPNTVVLNPQAETEIILRKDLSNMLYNGPVNLAEGSIGRMLGMNFYTQPGGYTDFEGETLSMFAPTTPGKGLAYVMNPEQFGYPVVFGAPEFTTVDNPSKNSVRIYVNAHAGFVYTRDLIEKITA